MAPSKEFEVIASKESNKKQENNNLGMIRTIYTLQFTQCIERSL